jgi:hypothetical protein
VNQWAGPAIGKRRLSRESAEDQAVVVPRKLDPRSFGMLQPVEREVCTAAVMTLAAAAFAWAQDRPSPVRVAVVSFHNETTPTVVQAPATRITPTSLVLTNAASCCLRPHANMFARDADTALSLHPATRRR